MLQETQSTQDDDELLLNLVISEIQSDSDPGMNLMYTAGQFLFIFLE